MHDDVILEISPPNTDSASSPGDQHELQSIAGSMEDDEYMLPDENDSDPQQEFESASYGEIEVVREISTLSGAENVKSAEQKQTGDKTLHLSCSQEIKRCYGDLVPEKDHYSFIMKDNFIKLELDNRTISIWDCPSSGQLENLSVNHGLNLIEQDLRLLSEKPDYPNSFLLFLQRNNHLTQIHDSFFNSMPDLRFLDMSDTRIRILPSSLFNLSKLKVLMLRNCVCLENLPSEIGSLSLMEVLDLSGTELYSLPDEIGKLTLLSYMQLSFYGPDDESEYAHLPSGLISLNFLSHLKALQSISITVHPDDHRWTKIAACIIKDVGMLGMLRYLELYFPEVDMFMNFIGKSPSWKNRKLRKFRFVVGRNVKRIASRVPNEIESLFDKHGQCLKFVNGDKVPRVIRTVLQRVEAFYLDHHIKIRSLSKFGLSNFLSLKFCLVRECPKIQAILDEYSIRGAFPCLEYLGVYYLWELEHICKTPRFSRSFQSLMYLTVSTCPKLKFILWESMLPCLSNLKELVVEDCESLEIIVKEEEKKVNRDAIMLPAGLRKVVLHYLPMLVSLGNGLCLSDDKISVYGCPKLNLNPQPREQTLLKQRKFLGSLRAALQSK